MQVASCCCIGHGNESISPHTRTLYPAGASARERKREREKQREERPRCCSSGSLTPFPALAYLPSYIVAWVPLSPLPFRLSSWSPAESNRTRNSQAAVRTLNARPCRTHALAHPDADKTRGEGTFTSRCLLIAPSLFSGTRPGFARSESSFLVAKRIPS